ncbi:cAMP-dependent protein kinase catalytic subunit 3-like [Galendromus occidentalis]|uniref:cAMP-dependent protein kinase catalytic subunit 3-like n=1 Tax=Galendromus occidentalis TaxID=34638 RepID=A0AAJ6QQ88_9ACAR|nr:cAMP-dependent protein kinase catalytic subunit 3-like [Galendromus occidentalis]
MSRDGDEDAIFAYRNSILHAETNFKARVAANDCPSTDVKSYEILTRAAAGKYNIIYKARKDGKICVIRQQLKKPLGETSMIDPTRIVQEKKFLYAMNSKFIVRIFAKDKDEMFVYTIMEYTPWGDLRRYLKNRAQPEALAVKMIGQVVLALEYIHACNIIYRDLKPDNILIFPGGRLKITDFKRACLGKYCGDKFGANCLYAPPEIINQALYTCAADWWACGILLYLILLNSHPFVTTEIERKAIFDRVLKKRLQVPEGDAISAEAKDLIKALLVKDHTKRLGSEKFGVDIVKRQDWFKDLDFMALISADEIFPLNPRRNHESREEPASADVFQNTKPDSFDEERELFKEF